MWEKPYLFAIFSFDQDVLGLDVSVKVPGLMEVIESLDNFCKDFSGFFESEYFSGLFGLKVKEIASVTVFADKILVVFVLLGVVEFHDVWGVEGFHAFDLAFQVIKEVWLLHETFHGDKFKGELLPFVCLDQQNLSVGTFTEFSALFILVQNHGYGMDEWIL